MTDAGPPDQDRILHEALGPAVWARQAALANHLYDLYGGVVAAGPFQGLRLLREVCWGVGDNAAKLVGLYEAELHPALDALAPPPPPAVVNVGCAEGYYAVGLARRFPEAAVYAFDVEPKAQLICRQTAALNGVGDRVSVLGACAPATLLELLHRHPTALLVIDCEGYEKELLAGAVLAAVGQASLIVECHDFVDPTITATLAERLGAGHAVEIVVEGARDPNHLEPLRKLSSLDRWLVVLENRPVMMNWIVARPLP
jgi:precorrin-6B methylase 2